MMIFNQTMKETLKRELTVILDDPRIGIGLNTIPEPSGLYQYAVFDADDTPETAPAASTANDSMLDALMMMFWSISNRATSARQWKLSQ
jgi:hypothetical protein